jgi:hypothetical protein
MQPLADAELYASSGDEDGPEVDQRSLDHRQRFGVSCPNITQPTPAVAMPGFASLSIATE